MLFSFVAVFLLLVPVKLLSYKDNHDITSIFMMANEAFSECFANKDSDAIWMLTIYGGL